MDKQKFIYFEGFKKLTPEQAKAIYHDLSKKYHPDANNKNTTPDAQKIMAEINHEYDLVTNWYKKQAERHKRNIEILNKLSEKAIEGLQTLQPKYEPELKEFALKKGKAFINKNVPKTFRDLAEIVLSKTIENANIVNIAQKGLQAVNIQLNKIKQ